MIFAYISIRCDIYWDIYWTYTVTYTGIPKNAKWLSMSCLRPCFITSHVLIANVYTSHALIVIQYHRSTWYFNIYILFQRFIFTFRSTPQQFDAIFILLLYLCSTITIFFIIRNIFYTWSTNSLLKLVCVRPLMRLATIIPVP